MPQLRLTCGPIELRLATPRAAPQLFQLARDPEVSQYLQWHAHTSIEDSLAYIREAARLWRRGIAYLPAVFDIERQTLLGSTGISSIDRTNRRAEVGTWLGVRHQGAGLNLPIKAAVFQLGFGQLGLERLELLVRTDNERSLAATRKLPALTDEGVQHARIWAAGEPHDAVMFSIVRGDWDPTDWPPVTAVGTL